MSIASLHGMEFGYGVTADKFKNSNCNIKGSVFKDNKKEFDGRGGDSCSSSSVSSSIGKNSDDVLSSGRSSSEECGGEDEEVQSCFKGSLDVMDALEEALPIRRGISHFYNGKSKSFTSLADASSAPSIKDITKVENAYTRRRRNLIAFNHVWDKNRNPQLRSNGGGISKRSVSLSKSALALAVAMSSSENSNDGSTDSSSSTPRSSPSLPPLYPQLKSSNKVGSSPKLHDILSLKLHNISAWRSFSSADLHHCTSSANTNIY